MTSEQVEAVAKLFRAINDADEFLAYPWTTDRVKEAAEMLGKKVRDDHHT